MYKESGMAAIDPRILNSPATLIMLGKAYHNLICCNAQHTLEEKT